VCIVTLLSSCSSKPENKIVGKWKEIGGTETMEFFKDGTVSVVDNKISLKGSYQFIDEKRIKFKLGGLGPLAGPIVEKVSFSGGELVLTMPDGKVSKYSKFK
jgi:hypothetical protein